MTQLNETTNRAEMQCSDVNPGVVVDACKEWRMSRPTVSPLSATEVRVSWSTAGSSVVTAVRSFKVQYRWIDKNQESVTSHWQTAAESVSPTRTYYDVTGLRTGILHIISHSRHNEFCCCYMMQ